MREQSPVGLLGLGSQTEPRAHDSQLILVASSCRAGRSRPEKESRGQWPQAGTNIVTLLNTNPPNKSSFPCWDETTACFLLPRVPWYIWFLSLQLFPWPSRSLVPVEETIQWVYPQVPSREVAGQEGTTGSVTWMHFKGDWFFKFSFYK